MQFAARINSFIRKYILVEKVIQALSRIDGITDVELNLPEHLDGQNPMAIADKIKDAGLNFSGAAMRFRHNFEEGEFGNRKNRQAALDLVKRTIDTVAEMGGSTMTIWLEFDGYDHSFQIDYIRYWDNIITAFQETADYNKDMKISIEFKPWTPRSFSIMPNTGTTLHALDCIDRDNVGMTLDYCHSLMAGENPAMSLALASMKGKLFGIHLNDGHGFADNGHVFGSVSVIRSLEFMYYLKQQKYYGLIYFDTFPIYVDPDTETALNIQSFKAYEQKLKNIGQEKILTELKSDNILTGQRFVMDNILNTP